MLHLAWKVLLPTFLSQLCGIPWPASPHPEGRGDYTHAAPRNHLLNSIATQRAPRCSCQICPSRCGTVDPNQHQQLWPNTSLSGTSIPVGTEQWYTKLVPSAGPSELLGNLHMPQVVFAVVQQQRSARVVKRKHPVPEQPLCAWLH
jgi:hypothetical protein